MRAFELGIYDPCLDRAVCASVGDKLRPRHSLRDLNRAKLIHRARQRQREQDLAWMSVMFGDPEVEEREIELATHKAELAKAHYEVEHARLEIERVKAETLAVLADAQKARAEAKLTNAKAWNA